jgi:hypothetical protein
MIEKRYQGRLRRLLEARVAQIDLTRNGFCLHFPANAGLVGDAAEKPAPAQQKPEAQERPEFLETAQASVQRWRATR